MAVTFRPVPAFPPARGTGAPHATNTIAAPLPGVAIRWVVSPAPGGAARGDLLLGPGRRALDALARVHTQIVTQPTERNRQGGARTSRLRSAWVTSPR